MTAISLIKQSKIANDDRCKILISSLQDTLHGIESKSYGSRYLRPGSFTHARMAGRNIGLLLQLVLCLAYEHIVSDLFLN